MRYHKLIILCVAFAAFLLPLPVAAQVCVAHYETITDLTPPTYGFPSVWDVKHGKDDELTQIHTAVKGDDNTVITTGRRLDKDDFSIKSIFITALNRRGRSMMSKSYDPKPSELPVKMLRVKDGFVVLSSIKGGRSNSRQLTRISWLKEDGAFRFDRIIDDNKYDYHAVGIVKASEKAGLVVIIHAENPDDVDDNHGVLVRFTPSGDRLWKRSYRPGIPNEILDLKPFDDGSYMAVGHIEQDDGRMGAWAMRLAHDGAVNWQRMYPRGAGSAFHSVDTLPGVNGGNTRFVFTGTSAPLDGMPPAAVVMQVGPLGEPQWTRYYRRKDYALNAKWIDREDDGRFVVVINAEANETTPGIYDHIRMLSLSPRGGKLTDESYYVGRGAKANGFIRGDTGERIVVATIDDDAKAAEEKQTPLKVIGLMPDEKPSENSEDEDAAVSKSPPIQRGWVLVGTALEPYEDPCAQMPQ